MERERFDKATNIANNIKLYQDTINDINKAEVVISFHQQLCWRLGRDDADALNERVRDEMRELVKVRKAELEKQFKEL